MLEDGEFVEMDEATEFLNLSATKIQSIIRTFLVRVNIVKELNKRYEKIFDPSRER